MKRIFITICLVLSLSLFFDVEIARADCYDDAASKYTQCLISNPGNSSACGDQYLKDTQACDTQGTGSQTTPSPASSPSGDQNNDQNQSGNVSVPPPAEITFFGLFKVNSIPELVVNIYKYSISIIGIIIFVQFIRAGIIYMAAAGNAGKVSEATSLMTNAVVGTILLFAAYLILNIINPDLLTLSLDLSSTGGVTRTDDGDVSGPTGDTGQTLANIGMTGTCRGSACSESGGNVCGDTTNACDGTEQWTSQITAGVQQGGNICGNINTTAFIKAIMSLESHGRIGQVSPKGAAGLMQILPSTGNQSTFKFACGITETVDAGWLNNPANVTKSICLAIQIFKSSVGSCGCDPRHLAAEYNGSNACGVSRDCGPSAGSGTCSACQGESTTRRWQCPWNESGHTTCNKDISGNFAETRKYVPQVSYCYKKFSGQQ